MKKSLFKLFSLCLFSISVMTFQSCGDSDPCKGVNCGLNGNCFEGTCMCEDGFTGVNCQTDVCENVDCGANGVCFEGVCLCDAGFSGTSCEIVQRTIFLGTYDAVEVCTSDPSFTDVYVMEAKTRAAAVNTFFIENIYNLTAFSIPTADATVVATITSDTTFDILEQNLSGSVAAFVVLGSGNIDGTTVTLNYTITDTSLQPGDAGYQDSCAATLTPR